MRCMGALVKNKPVKNLIDLNKRELYLNWLAQHEFNGNRQHPKMVEHETRLLKLLEVLNEPNSPPLSQASSENVA